MSRKRFSVEQIINHLREAEVLLAQDKRVGEIGRQIGVSEQSCYRWRREHCGYQIFHPAGLRTTRSTMM